MTRQCRNAHGQIASDTLWKKRKFPQAIRRLLANSSARCVQAWRATVRLRGRSAAWRCNPSHSPAADQAYPELVDMTHKFLLCTVLPVLPVLPVPYPCSLSEVYSVLMGLASSALPLRAATI